jgi:hypothetical protein
MLRTLVSATILAGALSGSVMAQTSDAGCALAVGTPGHSRRARCGDPPGRADKDRDCMKALLIPEARMIFCSGRAERQPIGSRP